MEAKEPRIITFPNKNQTPILRVPSYADPAEIAAKLGFRQPRPAIFISGGASAMSEEHINLTRTMITEGIARFAAEHKVAIIDGGTDAGIMQMVGRARLKYRGVFPLVGCAPEQKVTYPGSEDSGDQSRTALEPHHSHFVLVDADHWGAESDMIVGLARAISQEKMPAYGILINGGKIAQYDVYIASARGEKAMPVIVLDGSGRSADEIAQASKTGNFTSAMIRAIIQGGRIQIVSLVDGPQKMYDELARLYNK